MNRQDVQAGATPEAAGFNAGVGADDEVLQAIRVGSAVSLLEVLGRLMDLAGDNEQIARRLIDDVRTYQLKDLELLRAYCEQNDRQAIARLCHKMAGAACVLKYQPLISSCQRLREVSIAGAWPVLLERAQLVEQALLNLKDICLVAIQNDGPINLRELPRER
ncbi:MULTISPECIES: Hpt domain-containing protein [Pseudomonas]|uniref:Hpt domain-containing protein n=1 Tax=Pseudomonas TaxID=286 RepID=UPI000C88B3CF|nr:MULTISPECIES: Hpt domain-containing protein [Pseudomonas]NNB45316.1 Hpt domain-containing protein [Pseudomonas chlororaphis]PMY41879.1 histidine kinase [Pseudomonas sp. FW306-2-2C-D06C]PYC30453.1 Hpt domain-containing protein [Pseudomonas chlororaphis]